MRARRKRKQKVRKETGETNSKEKVKLAKPVNSFSTLNPMRLVRQVLSSPDLSYQVMVILLALTSDQKMDRRINTMSSTMDNLRNITEVLNNSVGSLKTAAEAPRKIRKLMTSDNS